MDFKDLYLKRKDTDTENFDSANKQQGCSEQRKGNKKAGSWRVNDERIQRELGRRVCLLNLAWRGQYSANYLILLNIFVPTDPSSTMLDGFALPPTASYGYPMLFKSLKEAKTLGHLNFNIAS